MPTDFNGYWKMMSNENFEEYLKALDVNVALRKIATLLKPDKDIIQNGEHMVIKTLSTFRNYIMEFDVGKEFEEDLSGVDDRKCMVRIKARLAHFFNKEFLSEQISFVFSWCVSLYYLCWEEMLCIQHPFSRAVLALVPSSYIILHTVNQPVFLDSCI
ncbi:unnamed protein product [Staurois parvus]|uniref:Cytosolic fatty-acid binding proteins domain-containing protein n=1 Tax=Staurois parvus TaxID=386267 RepID=A0ABN9D0U0_9NEOB|nr:unnamed protein product [Staurois parvus]